MTVENGGKYVRYFHYERNGSVCYLFANEDTARTLDATVRLRGFEGGSYTLYDPFENVAVTRHSKDGTIPLTLAPYNMVAVLIGGASLSSVKMIFEETNPQRKFCHPPGRSRFARRRICPHTVLIKPRTRLKASPAPTPFPASRVTPATPQKWI